MNKYNLIVVIEMSPCADLRFIDIEVETDAPLVDAMRLIGHYYAHEYPDDKVVSVEYRGNSDEKI